MDIQFATWSRAPRILVALALALVLTAATGCDASSPHSGASMELRSGKPRVIAPDVPPADAQQLASDDQAFAIDLYQVVRTMNQGNVVFSPASVSLAVAMLYGGTAGKTAVEVAQAMHFDLPAERLHPALNALDLALTADPASVGGAFRLAINNAAWAQRDLAVLPSYLDLLAQNYGVGMRLVDFTTAPDAARQTINAWVADNTDHKILELLQPNVISTNTRMVLTNAVYFLGDWQTPFAPKSSDGTFHAPAADVTVPMMTAPDGIAFWTGAGWSAAELPYVGGTTSMLLVVPDAGTFDAYEQSLTGDGLNAVLSAEVGAVAGALSMPRFKFATATSLKDALMALGMRQAFDQSAADLSGIDGGHDLFVKDVVHQAAISVDEKGTEASAATAVIVSRKTAVLNRLSVDRPFLFFIRHKTTGAILFQGRVLDPSQ